jgi:hypothetical protein
MIRVDLASGVVLVAVRRLIEGLRPTAHAVAPPELPPVPEQLGPELGVGRHRSLQRAHQPEISRVDNFGRLPDLAGLLLGGGRADGVMLRLQDHTRRPGPRDVSPRRHGNKDREQDQQASLPDRQPAAASGLVLDVLLAESLFQVAFFTGDGPPVHDKYRHDRQQQNPAVVQK